nr:hypothetical protein [Tanacetum cinerariifolium]
MSPPPENFFGERFPANPKMALVFRSIRSHTPLYSTRSNHQPPLPSPSTTPRLSPQPPHRLHHYLTTPPRCHHHLTPSPSSSPTPQPTAAATLLQQPPPLPCLTPPPLLYYY